MKQWETAYPDWIAGMKYREIAEKHGVSENTVKSWAARYFRPRREKEDATGERKRLQPTKKLQPREKRGPGAPIGNKNAVGNHGGAPPGNQNALKHGFYCKAVPQDDLAMLEAREELSEEQRLINEMNLWEYREYTIMRELNRYQAIASGLSVQSVTREDDKTATTAISTFERIKALETMLTTVQRGHLKCIEALSALRMELEKKRLGSGEEGPREKVVVCIPENGRDKHD